MNAAASRPTLRVWVLVLGASGFAAGFVGPVLLDPGANQGPLLGIFITGPGAALAGLILGAGARAADVRRRTGTHAGTGVPGGPRQHTVVVPA
jgi:hypothetical protein